MHFTSLFLTRAALKHARLFIHPFISFSLSSTLLHNHHHLSSRAQDQGSHKTSKSHCGLRVLLLNLLRIFSLVELDYAQRHIVAALTHGPLNVGREQLIE